MVFLPPGKKLSELLPENIRELHTMTSVVSFLDIAVQKFIDEVIEEALDRLKELQDPDRTIAPLFLAGLFNLAPVIAKREPDISLRLRKQIKVMPYVYEIKGTPESLQLYGNVFGLTINMIEQFNMNAVIIEILERLILDRKVGADYDYGYSYTLRFGSIDVLKNNIKRLLPMWVEIVDYVHKGYEVIDRLQLNDSLFIPDIEFWEPFEHWVRHRLIPGRGIFVEETNIWDGDIAYWDLYTDGPLYWDRSFPGYMNVPPSDDVDEVTTGAVIAGNTTASWVLRIRKILENTFRFTIDDGVRLYKGKDDGSGNIVDDGGSGTVIGGTIDYLTGAVSITVSPAFANDADIHNLYQFESDYLEVQNV